MGQPLSLLFIFHCKAFYNNDSKTEHSIETFPHLCQVVFAFRAYLSTREGIQRQQDLQKKLIRPKSFLVPKKIFYISAKEFRLFWLEHKRSLFVFCSTTALKVASQDRGRYCASDSTVPGLHLGRTECCLDRGRWALASQKMHALKTLNYLGILDQFTKHQKR